MYLAVWHCLFFFCGRCLEVLLKYSKHLGAVNERNNKFLSSLHLAVLADQPTSVELLLKSCVSSLAEHWVGLSNGALVNCLQANLGVSDQEGRTALHYAAITNAVLCIMAITQACVSGWKNVHGSCQLYSLHFFLPSVQPNDVNLVDCNGRTALHLACQIGSVECIKALINSPVYVIWFSSAVLGLCMLLIRNSFSCLCCVHYRCDCTLQDDNGLKPTDIAKACKRSDIVSLLQAKSK